MALLLKADLELNVELTARGQIENILDTRFYIFYIFQAPVNRIFLLKETQFSHSLQ